jgi:hypothetical protein
VFFDLIDALLCKVRINVGFGRHWAVGYVCGLVWRESDKDW